MRDWWLRTLLVLQRPRPVFVALRDDDPEAVAERAEPVLLIVWLAGIAAVLADATTYLDDATRDGVDLAIWAFLGRRHLRRASRTSSSAGSSTAWRAALGSHGTFRRVATRPRVRRRPDRALARRSGR